MFPWNNSRRIFYLDFWWPSKRAIESPSFKIWIWQNMYTKPWLCLPGKSKGFRLRFPLPSIRLLASTQFFWFPQSAPAEWPTVRRSSCHRPNMFNTCHKPLVSRGLDIWHHTMSPKAIIYMDGIQLDHHQQSSPQGLLHFFGPGGTHLFTSISRLGCTFLRQRLLLTRLGQGFAFCPCMVRKPILAIVGQCQHK